MFHWYNATYVLTTFTQGGFLLFSRFDRPMDGQYTMTHSIPDFSKVRVLVVGDVMIDRYWSGNASRISPEAPVPIMQVLHQESRLGGAAYVASIIASLGGQAHVLGLAGQDAEAYELTALLEARNIRHHLVQCPEYPTVTKLRVLSHHQQLIRLDFEKKFLMEHAQALTPLYKKALEQSDIVILSDYGKGSLLCSRQLIEMANQQKIPVFVDPKQLDFSVYHGATLIKPNFKEFEAAIGGACSSEQAMAEKARELIERCGLSALLVTRGEQGMTLFRPREKEIHVPTLAKEVFDVSGAGDTVIATLALSIASGKSYPDAIRLANVAAGIVVGKVGTVAVELHELRRAINNYHRGGIMTEETLAQAVADARAHGETIVMTNGCFDILHAGHVRYLEQAKQLGDRLIVAVNDDSSVKTLKGPARPINTLEDRMQVLVSLSAVDWVIPFSEETPERLIGKVLPDVLVKGGDWKVDQIAGARSILERGGQVKVLDFVDGKSTTAVINKMKMKEGENK